MTTPESASSSVTVEAELNSNVSIFDLVKAFRTQSETICCEEHLDLAVAPLRVAMVRFA